jgi:hypothetical protein
MRASVIGLVFILPMSGLGLPPVQTVFIIVLENKSWGDIQGASDAPYLNGTLLPLASHCEQYYTPPGLHPSERNYLWLEAGTDFGVDNNADPALNHQNTTNHLVAQLRAAGISWKAYQEDIGGTDVPLTSTNLYAPRHNPFVYFDDVTGTNNPNYAYGITHIRPCSELAADLANNTVARYNFITPNLCNDTHDSCWPLYNPIRQGDNWLAAQVPRILASQAYKNNGALFITWDEGSNDSDGPIGMIVLSPLARGGGYFNYLHYTHGSTLRTLQEIFGVTPLLGEAASATDLSDLFLQTPNHPPVLAPIADRTMVAEETLTFANSATDPDVPANALTFSLDPNAPSGATINATSGGFKWTPSLKYASTTNSISVRVTDNGVPPASDVKTFKVIVVARPQLLSIAESPQGFFTLVWRVYPGRTYRPEFKTNLSNTIWTASGANFTAATASATVTNNAGTNRHRFHRLLDVTGP